MKTNIILKKILAGCFLLCLLASAQWAAAQTAPTITAEPQDVSTNAGKSIQFAVSLSGSMPITNTWYVSNASSNTALFTAVTNNPSGSLTIKYTTVAVAGNSYYAVSWNNAGIVTSRVATVSIVATPPSITTQPIGTNISPGLTASFRVVAAGTAPLAYQWLFNGSALGSSTTSTLTVPNVSTNDEGSYKVVVTNNYGTVTSQAAVLTIAVQCSTPPEVQFLFHTNTVGDVILLKSLQPNATYTLQDSSNLVSWLNLYSFSHYSGTQLRFTNRAAITNSGLYYRISSP